MMDEVGLVALIVICLIFFQVGVIVARSMF